MFATVRQPTAGILYRGPSMLDGAPIVVVATYRTRGANAKTGAMLQTYIIRADVAPMDAIRSGADASICGDCPHRGNGTDYGTRSCYVNIGQGPRSVYDAFRRGRYADESALDRIRTMGRGRMVRIGTYGDPAAVPAEVWRALTLDAVGWTGYTHQWRRPVAAPLRALLMASADSVQDRADAVAMGWRTFRVRDALEPILPREFVCPASAEAGKRRTCTDCGACNGAGPGGTLKASPVIIAHGSLASRFASNRARIVPIARA